MTAQGGEGEAINSSRGKTWWKESARDRRKASAAQRQGQTDQNKDKRTKTWTNEQRKGQTDKVKHKRTKTRINGWAEKHEYLARWTNRETYEKRPYVWTIRTYRFSTSEKSSVVASNFVPGWKPFNLVDSFFTLHILYLLRMTGRAPLQRNARKREKKLRD